MGAAYKFRQSEHCMEPMSAIPVSAVASTGIMVSIPLTEVTCKQHPLGSHRQTVKWYTKHIQELYIKIERWRDREDE